MKTWHYVAGGLGAALVGTWLYQHHRNLSSPFRDLPTNSKGGGAGTLVRTTLSPNPWRLDARYAFFDGTVVYRATELQQVAGIPAPAGTGREHMIQPQQIVGTWQLPKVQPLPLPDPLMQVVQGALGNFIPGRT